MNFIHFGCWNNGKCDTIKSENSISQVMKKINEFKNDPLNKIDFAVIAGDNYYSSKIKEDKGDKADKGYKADKGDKTDKTDKIKMFNKDNFESGVECLKNSLPEIKKYILLGNHEYDKVTGLEGDINKCNLMRLQQKTFTSDKKFNFFTNIMIEESDNTLIIMIDTTLYEYKEEFDKYCDEVFPEINKNRGYENLVKYQENRVIDILNQHQTKKNIIVIGHHPIITVKAKEDKEDKEKKIKEKTEVLDGLVELFVNITQFLKDKKIYYMCADNHLQQEGIIKIGNLEINQYVAGTGGAELDKCIIEIKKDFDFDNLKYNMTKCKSINGFYYVTEKGDNLEFEFIEVDSIEKQEGGYREKYLKYKQKYLNLKKFELI
jgi:predicted MPP superfamily phosphohydrolase